MRLQASKPVAASSMVRAACMLTDQVGDLVAVRSTANGSYKVWRADPTTPIRMPAVGVIVRKWNTTDCVVQLGGPIFGIYSSLVPGKRYFVGLNGRPTLSIDFTDPGPGERYRIQTFGVALNLGILLLVPSADMVIRVG